MDSPPAAGMSVASYRLMSRRTETTSVVGEAVRAACLNAARLAYEDAGIRGLCADARWEVALGAIRQLDLSSIVESIERESAD